MHACGHDGHIAVLLGTIKALYLMRDQLDKPITFIFQPAEETATGAAAMVRDGALENVSHVFGLHGWPDAKVGTLFINKGPMLASGDFFDINISNLGTSTTKQLLAAAEIIEAISRQRPAFTGKIDDSESVVTITQLSGKNIGKASGNIIPEHFGLKIRPRQVIHENLLNSLKEQLNTIARETKSKISTRIDPANKDLIDINIIGLGGHGAMPEKANNPLVIGTRVIKMISRNPAFEILEANSADRNNRFNPNQILELKGTMRTYNVEVRKHLILQMEKVIEKYTREVGTTGNLAIDFKCHAVVNEPNTTDQVINIINSSFGKKIRIESTQPVMGSEDFSFFLSSVGRGTFIFLGVCPVDQEKYPSLHNERYDFTDGSIKIGIRSFVEIARQFRVD